MLWQLSRLHTLVDPCDEVFGAVACALGFGVTMPKNGIKIYILYAVQLVECSKILGRGLECLLRS